jgi:tripartite-type tricarboxylate transporter receptor subunit TctC
MQPMKIFPALASLLLTVLCTSGLTATAQTYPSKPIRMMVPAAPGGVTDIAARAIAPQMTELLGQPIIVDNRSGAGGVPGTDIVAKASADGYTLLAVFDSFISNPFVFGNAPYDTIRDFAPVSLLIRGPQLLVVHPKLGIKSFNDLLAAAKVRRAPFNFATAGAATSSRLSVELFKSTTQLDAMLIHYKGGGPALTDLVGGHVDAMIASAGLVLSQVKSGRLTVLAVTSRERSALVPGVPALSEFVPRFEALSWVGVLAPAGTPANIVMTLNSAAIRASNDPANAARYASQGIELVGSSPAEFQRFIASESSRLGKVITAAKIQPE